MADVEKKSGIYESNDGNDMIVDGKKYPITIQVANWIRDKKYQSGLNVTFEIKEQNGRTVVTKVYPTPTTKHAEPTKEELDRSREEYNATAAKMKAAGFGQPTPGPAKRSDEITVIGEFKNINKFNQIGVENKKGIHTISASPDLLAREKENFAKNGGMQITVVVTNHIATDIKWTGPGPQQTVQQPAAAPAVEPAPQKVEEPKKDEWGEEFARFKGLLLSVKRDGTPEFLQYLEKETDFFIAPSSTHYHDARDGGLLHHSLSVYDSLTALSQVYAIEIPEESRIVISLLHDICKTNFYRKEKKSLPRKDEKGDIVLDDWGRKIWDETLVWTIDDQLPLGHGEKSVILILQHGLKLTDEEIAAIRWHMMAYDDVKGSYAGNLAITNASDKWRIIPLVHMADLAASFLELKKSEVAPEGE